MIGSPCEKYFLIKLRPCTTQSLLKNKTGLRKWMNFTDRESLRVLVTTRKESRKKMIRSSFIRKASKKWTKRSLWSVRATRKREWYCSSCRKKYKPSILWNLSSAQNWATIWTRCISAGKVRKNQSVPRSPQKYYLGVLWCQERSHLRDQGKAWRENRISLESWILNQWMVLMYENGLNSYQNNKAKWC